MQPVARHGISMRRYACCNGCRAEVCGCAFFALVCCASALRLCVPHVPCRHAAWAIGRVTHGTAGTQVIEAYCRYADAMVGHWSTKDDGYQTPSLRVLLKPLYNIFHGERGGRRWKAAMDETLRTDSSIKTLSELVNCTLDHVDCAALDAPPCTVNSTFAPFTAQQTGSWPPDDIPPIKAVESSPELVAADS